MNLKTNLWISSKSVFKWTWRNRCCSSVSTSLNIHNDDESYNYLRKLKYPESMFVHNNDVASMHSTFLFSYNLKQYHYKLNCLIILCSIVYIIFTYFLHLEAISDIICVNLNKRCNTQINLIEVNPGPCLITSHILANTNYNISVYESNYNTFKNYLSVSIYNSLKQITGIL